MKTAVIVTIIMALICIVGGVFLVLCGFFYTPQAKQGETGPYYYAYEDFTGSYSRTYPVFSRVYAKLNDAGIKNSIGIGIYYDDPETVPAEKLRSSCGSVIDKADEAKAAAAGLKTGYIGRTKSVIVEFPVRINFAYMFAPRKIYPVLKKYLKENNIQNGAPYEIYDVANKKMMTVIPILK